MNSIEIENAAHRYARHVVLGPATRTLLALMRAADSNSDGWAYWPKPARAAAKLMALIEGDDHAEGRRGARFDGERADATPAKLKAALAPIKAFRTREKIDFTIYASLEDVESGERGFEVLAKDQSADELFGPLDIIRLKEGKVRRLTDGYAQKRGD